MMIHFRDASIADIPLLRELTMNVWPQTYSKILSREQINYMLEMMYSPQSLAKQMNELNHQFIIGYDGKIPVVFASFSPKSSDNSLTWRVHKIYIIPGQQGKGIGKSTIEYISETIRLKGGKSLELNVNRYNPAKSFYEKIGFTVCGEEDIDIGNGYFMNDFVMSYDI